MRKRIQSIEFFRVIFACCIAVWHLSVVEKLRHGYLPTDFFFFLSGIWLCSSYSKKRKNHYTAFQYTIDKIKRLYPEYFIACAIFLTISFKRFLSISDWIKVIPELLLLQHTGIYMQGLNYPLWYLSVLLAGGYFVYALLEHYGLMAIKLLCPVIAVGTYTYIFSMGDSIENWNAVGPFAMPLMRGIAGLSIGVCLQRLSSWIEEDERRGAEYFVNVLSLISIFGIFACISSEEFLDKYFLIFSASILISCLLKRSWLNKIIRGTVWQKLGSYTLEVFMVHASVIELWRLIPWRPFGVVEKSAYLLAYLVMVFLCAALLKNSGEILRKGIHKCIKFVADERDI